MKTKNHAIENLFRKYQRILAAGVMTAVLFTSAGCRSRETEFLKGTEIPANVPETEEDCKDASEREALMDGEVKPDGEKLPENDPSSKATEPADPPEDAEPEKIFVDVCGAVTSPGVFELPSGSRVFQAVEAAGGLLAEAAGEYVNLAGRLEDGQQIYIPARDEAESMPSLKSPLEKSISDGTPGNGNSCAAQAETAGKINLNTADEAALTTLTGIGASKAQAILAYREEHGGFSVIEEILNVPGIKEGTFMKIKDNIAVE